eukprot:CAMPEP_0198143640 /NCGR_PEP_ID=MMETSP1443-20131203/8594_1 /TAXON_ID=186043 /ORGANISM="Entomoneis sp., Strain CCMP2396" /LENGTH=379 /DNA_ID=CAMNT_0043806905 /DNA_START=3 /DNA_END=1142 /DNA_ORIENTATION=-
MKLSTILILTFSGRLADSLSFDHHHSPINNAKKKTADLSQHQEPIVANRQGSSSHRRAFVAACTSSLALLHSSNAAHAVRAVGGSEIECRAAGNCLEKGELDGALGWSWGAKDRCDTTDPTCGASGKQMELDENGQLVGKPVPATSADQITHIALIRIDIGRDESSVLRLGLYGNDAPASVAQFIDFMSDTGLLTKPLSSDSIGALTSPVAFVRGGVATWIDPGTSIEFGVPSQANAEARSKGRAKLLDSFVPQPRPKSSLLENDDSVNKKSHDAAGLLSISKMGLGYGGTGFETDDECYERAFLITDAPTPKLNQNRRVIGQVLDAQSMAFLERLSNLPSKRGIRGVIPGQTDGPPLPKVIVRDVTVAVVVNKPGDSA